ncbi:ParB/RepB/Spo0J family partition protein [Erythrobacteraceae bacterium E2-1 Yellow Sea]|nr:ParB/RepB/Spo0J family partition protein [Erythrobacteraceae bacterium E2-1 Yellow Sea]
MAKGNKGFGSLLTESLEDDIDDGESAPARSVMASRSEALNRLASGKVVTDRTEFVDPARCKPWRMHNRDLDHLAEESCRDLIDAFLSAKKQRIPAIVRRLRDEPDFDYEIIAGVRRWWTVQWLREHNHPEFDYLVTVQQLTDEEAFRVSDVENRSRKDITDWERAREYEAALAEFYEGSLAQMAEHLNISPSWLNRMLNVARLPEGIVEAFADRHDITVRIARDLKPLVKDAQARSRMEIEAKAIVSEREGGALPVSGPEAAKRLLKAATVPVKPVRTANIETLRSKGGKDMLTVSRAKKGNGLTIKILPNSGAEKAELLAMIAELL